MDTDKLGKTRATRRDGRPGSGLLIRPHVGAETRVKSGGRADNRSGSAGTTSSGQSAARRDRSLEDPEISE
jgi:hypothetical protein